MKYKLLVLDIDGTLVGKDTTVSPENKRALQQAVAKGLTVTLCTGRAPRGAMRVLNQLALDGFHTFFDGALVINPETERVVYTQALENEMLSKAVHWASDHKLELDLYSATQYFAEQENWSTWAHRGFFSVAPVITRFENVIGREVIVKIGTVAADNEQLKKVQEFEDEFKDVFNFTRVKTPAYPETDFINVVSPHVSKGKAILKLAAFLGIKPDQIIAIGDGWNDVSLLSAAGFAVAMPHAPEELKAIADYITLGVEENGVAAAVAKFILDK